MGRMTGKVIIVTGGARGQGAAHGAVCAREGAQVVLADVLDTEGSATAERLRAEGLDVDYVHLDVTSPENWQAAVDFAVERFGRLTSLVNNAGINGTMAAVVEETLAGWDAVVGVNQKGVFLGMKYCVPAMKSAGGGAIVNISSIWGYVGADEYISYQASKGAVRMMTKSAALTYAKDGIRVNTVCPGQVDTPMGEADGDDVKQAVLAATPMHREAQPEEISWGVLYLLSDEASFVTGTDLIIDGGYTAQ